MSKEERIYRWGVAVTKVEIVKAINKNFAGLTLSNEIDTLRVIEAVNNLLGQITQIGDLADTGLGIPAYNLYSGEKHEQKRKNNENR